MTEWPDIPKAHALLSPSSAHRWVPCPKSVAEEQRYPDETTPYAQEGQAAHELASFLLKGGGLDASDTIGTLVAGVTVTPEMALHVQTYIDFVRARPGEHWIEYAVPISEWTGEPAAKGTADHIAIAPGDARGDILYVTDLKFGVGHRVEAEGNYQLRMYGLGALADPGYLANVRHVVMTIVQPRLDHVSSVEMPVEELVEWGETVLRPAAQRAMDPDAVYNPGAEQCRFCRARHECPARRELVLDTIARKPWEAGEPDLDALAADLAVAALAREWAASIEDRATQIALGGAIVPGWKLVESRTKRRWRDFKTVVERLRGIGLKPAQYLAPRALVSPTQVGKLLPKKIREELNDLIDRPRGRPVLAPVTDRRPALDFTTDLSDLMNITSETEETEQ